MRQVRPRTTFKQDLKRERKGRYRIDVEVELWKVIDNLADNIPLDPSYNDHPLHGKWKGARDCHVKPDLLLLYRFEGDDLLILERLGPHSEIFGL